MLPGSSRSRSRTSSARVSLRSRKSCAASLSCARNAIEPGSAFGGSKAQRELVQRLGVRAQVDDFPHRLLAETFLAAQRREEARVDDRRLAAARAADDRDDIGRRALPDLLDKLFDEALPAEEEARVLLAERQKAAIGREAGEQLFGRGGVDRLALRAGDEALEAFRLIEAVAQIDPGVEAEKAADGDGVVRRAPAAAPG